MYAGATVKKAFLRGTILRCWRIFRAWDFDSRALGGQRGAGRHRSVREVGGVRSGAGAEGSDDWDVLTCEDGRQMGSILFIGVHTLCLAVV